MPPLTETTHPPRCPFCGTPGVPIHAGLTDRLWGVPGEWSLVRCQAPACGLAWISPMPSLEQIPALYARYYTHEAGETADNRPAGARVGTVLAPFYSLLLRITGIRHQRRELNDLYLGGRKPGRLLEVGCGDGRRLRRLRKRGWEVEGQEVDPQAAVLQREPDIPVHLGELTALGLPGASYDAIALNHVIEHVPDPVALVAECRRLLSPGGVLVVVTPNLDSTGHRLFGDGWRGLEPPRHLHLFTAHTLASLAQRSGFNTFGTWTTAAKAETFSAGSVHQNASRGHPATAHTVLTDMGFQLRAWMRWLKARDSGEECVLMATRATSDSDPEPVAMDGSAR